MAPAQDDRVVRLVLPTEHLDVPAHYFAVNAPAPTTGRVATAERVAPVEDGVERSIEEAHAIKAAIHDPRGAMIGPSNIRLWHPFVSRHG